MSNQRVLVTYTAPQPFQASESWKRIREALLAQLPLRNIHWKSNSRPSIRTIQELDISLVPLETLRDEHTSQIPVTLLEKPLLNIYVVTCEDFDVETYRNSVKRQIKDWHSVIAQRKNQEWLILHVVRPDSKMHTGNFFHLKGSVLDKMRTDFNLDKRDRCVQLVWSVTGNDNPASWADLITKIKDGILSAFDCVVVQREEDVKRSESQRQMPGWNFCTFFILKESLASSFEGVNLFEDALQQYDELETYFYQVLKEKKLSWFGTLISPSPEDDSLPLLSISKKPYRALILANTISVFDFRIYLLACQCALLGKMGRVNEVSRKTSAFLGGFGRRLREVEADLPDFFVESWTYSSALSVVDQCDIWASDFKLEGSDVASFHAGKGELLELALTQLEIIGIKLGRLPPQPPFSMTFAQPSSPALKTTQSPSLPKISKAELLSSLESGDVFYDLYVNVTNRAIDMYAKAGRRKFALKLHGSLAALDLHRGRLSEAVNTYTSLTAHYAPNMWTSLQSFMLSRALDTHADLGKPKDKEWIQILLSFLSTYIDSVGMRLLIHEDDKVTYVSNLVEALKGAADGLENDMSYSDHSAISIWVPNVARMAEAEDGSFLEVTVQNHLPCAIPVDQVSVILKGRDTERFGFVATTESLEPGKTSLKLFCPTSSSGTYVFDSSEIQISRLLLKWNYRKTKKSLRGSKEPATLVRIPRDFRSLDVRLRRPRLIELGKLSQLLVAIYTGRNHVTQVTIKLSGPAGISFRYQDATLQNGDPECLQVADDCVKVIDVSTDQIVQILVPHSDASALHAMKVSIHVEYFTISQPTIPRTLQVMRVVATSLPISVNVQDFFRRTRLFSKFTISTTTHQHVQICSAQLRGPAEDVDGVRISGSSTQGRVITVTPSQSANFLFYLDSAYGPVRESLSLVIKYRMLREEVESLIKHSVEDAIGHSSRLSWHPGTLINRLVEVLEKDATWVALYGVTGELVIPSFPGESEFNEALSVVKENLRGRKYSHPLAGEWHEIVIPVDVPRMTIVAAARISMSSASPVYAGQPISAVLTIHTSFHWGSSADDKERRYMMRFDVEEMIRDWLVSGRKRGDFAAMDGATLTVPITLVALHHGEIALPKVAITALPLTGELTMGSMPVPGTEAYQMHGAERVLVLPRGGRSTFVVGMGEEGSN